MFWDLLQQMQLGEQRDRAVGLEARVNSLELEVDSLRETLRTVLQRLEEHLGEDIDQDGQIGS